MTTKESDMFARRVSMHLKLKDEKRFPMHTKGIKEQAEGVLRTNSREGFSEPSHLVVGPTNPPAEFFLALLKAPQRWKSANCESCCSAFWGVSNWNVGLCHFGASRQISLLISAQAPILPAAV